MLSWCRRTLSQQILSQYSCVRASLSPTHCTGVQPPVTSLTKLEVTYVLDGSGCTDSTILLPSGERQRVKRGQWSRSECTVCLQILRSYQARWLLLLLHHGSYYCWLTCYLTLLYAYTRGMSYALRICLVLQVLYPYWSSFIFVTFSMLHVFFVCIFLFFLGATYSSQWLTVPQFK